jgi:hypothetical protein
VREGRRSRDEHGRQREDEERQEAAHRPDPIGPLDRRIP